MEKPTQFLVTRFILNATEKINVVFDVSFVEMDANFQSDDETQLNELLANSHTKLYSLFAGLITIETKKSIR
ncbi:MAG: hypothetical protein LH473_07660 [Chitinophagales bacterium]|nr:hypothetical protein [Chitinophagales bacterium]